MGEEDFPAKDLGCGIALSNLGERLVGSEEQT